MCLNFSKTSGREQILSGSELETVPALLGSVSSIESQAQKAADGELSQNKFEILHLVVRSKEGVIMYLGQHYTR